MAAFGELSPALREACTASLYGLDARYRHDDPFEASLSSVTRWALSTGRYERASVDLYTGSGHLTLAGDATPGEVLDVVYEIVARDHGRDFHAWGSLAHAPAAPSVAAETLRGGWAGATLLAFNGAPIGSVNVWSDLPVEPDESTRSLMLVLARATMHTLEGRRHIWSSRANAPAGPRAVLDRRAQTRPDASGS